MRRFFVIAIFIIALLILWTNKDSIFSSKNPPDIADEAQNFFQPDLFLPDLVIRKPEELYVQNGQERKIRFDTSFFHQGEGPLAVLGDSDQEKQITLATQIISLKSGNK